MYFNFGYTGGFYQADLKEQKTALRNATIINYIIKERKCDPITWDTGDLLLCEGMKNGSKILVSPFCFTPCCIWDRKVPYSPGRKSTIQGPEQPGFPGI